MQHKIFDLPVKKIKIRQKKNELLQETNRPTWPFWCGYDGFGHNVHSCYFQLF